MLGKNILGKWDALVTFPSYLKMKEDLIKNSGDIIVPEGSEIIWSCKTRNVSKTKISTADQQKQFRNSGFNFKAKFLKTQNLNIVLTNTYTNLNDSLSYTVEVIKDAYPTITVEELKDSLKEGVRYFQGMVSDDYGLKNLNFHYTVKAKSGKINNKVINFQNVKGTRNSFVYNIDFNKENIALEDEVIYFFSISDNDGVNGSKISKSGQFVYKLPSLSEFN